MSSDGPELSSESLSPLLGSEPDSLSSDGDDDELPLGWSSSSLLDSCGSPLASFSGEDGSTGEDDFKLFRFPISGTNW